MQYPSLGLRNYQAKLKIVKQVILMKLEVDVQSKFLMPCCFNKLNSGNLLLLKGTLKPIVRNKYFRLITKEKIIQSNS